MSGTAELADLYAAIEEATGLLDITCSRDKVWPVLSTYGDSLADAVIAFRVTTDARSVGDFDCRFTIPKDVDPYALALSNGLTAETDHLVGALLSDIEGRFPLACYAVDFGVVGGFKKIWTFFPPDDLQELATLAGIPSMPRSLADNLDLFVRYGLGSKTGVIGIDYPHRTVNVYFGKPSAEYLEPKNILSMLREIGLPDPSEQLLKLSQDAFGVYVTLNWDSSKVERISFSIMASDSTPLPVQLEPKIEHFVKNAAVEGRFGYGVALSVDGEYYKFQSYHQWRPQILSLMQMKSTEDPVQR